MKPLSQRQQDIYDFIESYINENERPPSLREIMKAFDVSSTNGIQFHLNALVKRGMITREPHSSRSIRLTQNRRDVTAMIQEAIDGGHAVIIKRNNEGYVASLWQPGTNAVGDSTGPVGTLKECLSALARKLF